MANYRKRVEDYATAVLDGTIVAGRYVKMACQRYFKDVDDSESKGWYLNEDIANLQIDFIQRQKHTKGKWSGKNLILSPSQLFCTWNVLAFRWVESNLRRFKEFYATVARKWGKSTYIAGVSNCLLFYDFPMEVEAEGYVTATKEEQAARLLTQASKMIENSDDLQDHALIYRHRETTKSIVLPGHPYNGSYFKALGSDSRTADSLNPHFTVRDELHEWKKRHRALKEKLDTGSGSRPQYLNMTITTAGDDQSEIWIEVDNYACKVLESAINGECNDDEIFAFIARIDEERPCECGGANPDCELCEDGDIPGDDPLDEANWPKANPDLGVTPTIESLRSNARKAANSPSLLSQFVRYHANSKVRSAVKLFNPVVFASASDSSFVDWSGNCSGAWDIGVEDDLAGLARCKRIDDKFYFSAIGFCPSDGQRKLDEQPFAQFIDRGELIATPGSTTDIREIRECIFQWSEDFGVSQWAFDPNNSRQLSQDVEEEGIDCFKFSQTFAMYNEAIRLFSRLLREGRIVHDGSELLKWCASNICRKESNGLWMPDKENSEDKIDPMVAVLMAFRVEALGENNQESVYKSRGVLAF